MLSKSQSYLTKLVMGKPIPGKDELGFKEAISALTKELDIV